MRERERKREREGERERERTREKTERERERNLSARRSLQNATLHFLLIGRKSKRLANRQPVV